MYSYSQSGRAFVNAPAGSTTTLVAPTAFNVVAVLALAIQPGSSDTTVTLLSSDGTPITPALFLKAGSAPVVWPYNPFAWCESVNPNDGLSVQVSSGATIGVQVVYGLKYVSP